MNTVYDNAQRGTIFTTDDAEEVKSNSLLLVLRPNQSIILDVNVIYMIGSTNMRTSPAVPFRPLR